MVPRGPKSLEKCSSSGSTRTKIPGKMQQFWFHEVQNPWKMRQVWLETQHRVWVVAASFNQAFALDVGPGGGNLQVG